jgi:hypothetical protein
MIDSIETLATEQLRLHNGQTMTLSDLHATLVDELGLAAGTYHQLYQRLKRSSHRFVLFERPSAVYPSEFPDEWRSDYERALRTAGLDLSPVVTLVPQSDEADDVLSTLRETLLTLSKTLQSDEAVASELIETVNALEQVPWTRGEVQQPTSRPRRPRR